MHYDLATEPHGLDLHHEVLAIVRVHIAFLQSSYHISTASLPAPGYSNRALTYGHVRCASTLMELLSPSG